MRVNTKMPAITSAVPAATHSVKGSPKIHTPMRMVDNGPTILMGVWILGEPFTLWVAAGTALVIAGIFVFTRMSRQPVR